MVAVEGIPEVFLDSLEMEENARSTIYAASLGPLKPITPEEVELLKVSFARNDYRVAKTWEHYQEKARLAGFLYSWRERGASTNTGSTTPTGTR